MPQQGSMNALFIGTFSSLETEVARILAQYNIAHQHLHDPEKMCNCPQQDVSNIGVVIICGDIPEDQDEGLGRLLNSSQMDFLPVIQILSDGQTHLESLRTRRLLYTVASPYDPEDLVLSIQVAMMEYKRYHKLLEDIQSRSSAIGLIQSGRFSFTTLGEAKNLTTMLSLACPNPRTAALVLSELMVNAVEHGNLGITYDEKQELLQQGDWLNEVNRRLAMERNQHKRVFVEFEKEEDGCTVTIEDMGDGFEWEKYNPEYAKKNQNFNGRGIGLVNAMTGCQLHFIGTGNMVSIKFSNEL